MRETSQFNPTLPVRWAVAVAGEGSCTINLAFKPSAAGARSATLVISDSDPSSPQTVSLSGTGT